MLMGTKQPSTQQRRFSTLIKGYQLMTPLPTLYKRNQIWKVEVQDRWVHITHGTINGQQQKESQGFHSSEDAQTDATRRWNKKVDRESYWTTPYHRPLTPMLVTEYQDHHKKLPTEVYIQPKLDGVRCVADNCVLVSRQDTIFCSVPHIKDALSILPDGIKVDGELYVEGLEFQEILELVKRDVPHEDFLKVKYHVFDLQSNEPYKHRLRQLISLPIFESPHIKLVPTEKIDNDYSLITIHRDSCIFHEYEGVIIRAPHTPYEYGSRSYGVQRFKREDTTEFRIIGWKAASRGREQGCAIAICETGNGQSFTARLTGSLEGRRSLMESPPPPLGRLFGRILHYGFYKTGIPKQPRCDSFFYGPKL